MLGNGWSASRALACQNDRRLPRAERARRGLSRVAPTPTMDAPGLAVRIGNSGWGGSCGRRPASLRKPGAAVRSRSPAEIAASIAEDLETALARFRAVATRLG